MGSSVMYRYMYTPKKDEIEPINSPIPLLAVFFVGRTFQIYSFSSLEIYHISSSCCVTDH
jgi:hypothetical protein